MNEQLVPRTSNPCNVPETLRSIVREGNAWPSAGIISEAANLLDDADTLLGRLAECFGDDETEFADIKLMRDRIADVDTRARHDATDESSHRHSSETRACTHHFISVSAGWYCTLCQVTVDQLPGTKAHAQKANSCAYCEAGMQKVKEDLHYDVTNNSSHRCTSVSEDTYI